MACGNMDLLQALAFVRNKRPICSPNEGFMGALLELEAEFFQDTSLDIELYREDRFSSSEELCIAEYKARPCGFNSNLLQHSH